MKKIELNKLKTIVLISTMLVSFVQAEKGKDGAEYSKKDLKELSYGEVKSLSLNSEDVHFVMCPENIEGQLDPLDYSTHSIAVSLKSKAEKIKEKVSEMDLEVYQHDDLIEYDLKCKSKNFFKQVFYMNHDYNSCEMVDGSKAKFLICNKSKTKKA